MFERFTRSARVAVVLAQEDAREAGASEIGAEHLLLGAVREDPVVAGVLRLHGVEPERLDEAVRSADELDGDALSALGIDLDEVRRRAEGAFGPGALDGPRPRTRRRRRAAPGHLPFSDEAKAALAKALHAAVQGHDTEISAAHVFLGLLAVAPGTAARLLERCGLDASPEVLRRSVRARLDEAA